MSVKWAEEEIRIACERERDASGVAEGWDYGCACYESALKAYRSMAEDDHSGMSWSLTAGVLRRLLAGKPLTPIEDVPEVWERCTPTERGGSVMYQCNRMCSLFKDVTSDGTVTYNDVGRAVGFDVGSSCGYHSGLSDRVVAERWPITMPYYPAVEPYKVFTETFLTDPKNGDYDTQGILYVITPDGERVAVDEYYKDSEIETGMVRISKEEYEERKARRVDQEQPDGDD